MILYPTETLYALGVNVLNPSALTNLFVLKGRDSTKVPSWLVRSIDDITTYAELSPVAETIATTFLPGEMTLILPAYEHLSSEILAPDRTIGFRISNDPMAQAIIEAYMEEYSAPLSCTSANVSGMPTLPTVEEILQQFGPRAQMIDEIHDDGPRKGLASTVIKVIGDKYEVLREGNISEEDIRKALK